MADSKLKKAKKPGSKRTFTALFLVLLMILSTFGSFFGMKQGILGLLRNILAFFQMNPLFAAAVGLCVLPGTEALSKLLTGGTKLGDTSQVSDLDKL